MAAVPSPRRRLALAMVWVAVAVLGCGADSPAAPAAPDASAPASDLGPGPSDLALDGTSDASGPLDVASDVSGPHDVASDVSGPLDVQGGPDAGRVSICRDPGTPGATAACLSPTQPPEYYVEQALKYFDTLDVDADPESIPAYSELVARWEWPPWLLLTGYGRQVMIDTAAFLRDFDPSTVPERECRFFEVQPFARCYVVFEYEGGPCPIYEEFVFNDAGEMTFIEAWSDLPGLRPMAADDRWAEDPDFVRLSTRVPGLGTPTGLLDLDGEWMAAAATNDADLADFVRRARDFWGTWMEELQGAPEDFFARGCGWPEGG